MMVNSSCVPLYLYSMLCSSALEQLVSRISYGSHNVKNQSRTEYVPKCTLTSLKVQNLCTASYALISHKAVRGEYVNFDRRCMKVMEFYTRLLDICGSTAAPPPTTTRTTTRTTTTTTSTTTTTTTTTTPKPCSTVPTDLATLYQLYNSGSNDHFYTKDKVEADNAVTMYNYMLLSSPGRVALSADCPCGASLVPAYRFYTNEHFYTTSQNEVDYVKDVLGATVEGIGWYCSLVKDLCGATLPLYRFSNNGDHIYVTDTSQVQGFGEGITCYIWPS